LILGFQKNIVAYQQFKIAFPKYFGTVKFIVFIGLSLIVCVLRNPKRYWMFIKMKINLSFF